MDEIPYVGALSTGQFFDRVGRAHPWLADMIDPDRIGQIGSYLCQMQELSWEFEADAAGGRGSVYNVAQKAYENRAVGMTALLGLFSESGTEVPGPDRVILDALAGDGTISRFAATLPQSPTIISADLSGYMITQCLRAGLPCIRQSASRSLLRDDVLDGVLIAYGSHHLPAEDRREAAREAHRTLKPGGKFVLHDFETGGPVDRWFGEVVDPYSATGHPHPHFSQREMTETLTGAGYADVRVFEMEDPFTLQGPDPEEARRRALRHLYNMYGLVKLPLETDADYAELERLAARTLGEISVQQVGGGWVARLERPALIAVGTK